MATSYTSQNWPGACLPGSRHLLQPVRLSCHAACNICERRACCRPVSPGGAKEISTSPSCVAIAKLLSDYPIDKPLALLFIYRETLVSHLGMETGSAD
jgi:hypothetical protein